MTYLHWVFRFAYLGHRAQGHDKSLAAWEAASLVWLQACLALLAPLKLLVLLLGAEYLLLQLANNFGLSAHFQAAIFAMAAVLAVALALVCARVHIQRIQGAVEDMPQKPKVSFLVLVWTVGMVGLLTFSYAGRTGCGFYSISLSALVLVFSFVRKNSAEGPQGAA
ncbi:hypothetical protein ACW7G0_14020 [Lysobacter sp. A286]